MIPAISNILRKIDLVKTLSANKGAFSEQTLLDLSNAGSPLDNVTELDQNKKGKKKKSLIEMPDIERQGGSIL